MFEDTGWTPTGGWIATLRDTLPPAGEVVWVARWLTAGGDRGRYEVVQDELFNSSLFLKDALQHGVTYYWQPIVERGTPYAPPVPESLPAHIRAGFEASEPPVNDGRPGRLKPRILNTGSEIRGRYQDLLGEGYSRESAWEVVDQEYASEVAALVYLMTDREFNKRDLWQAGYYE